MSSHDRGTRFEKIVEAELRAALASKRLGLLPESATVYWHKGYFSKDRNDVIVIDVSIEIVLPGASTWSILWAWECKDYERPVEVGEVEEFYSKLLQIGGVNVKGGFASTGPLQRSALEYAKAKGIAVARMRPGGFEFGAYQIMRPLGWEEPPSRSTEEICDDEITAFSELTPQLELDGPIHFPRRYYGISSRSYPHTSLAALVEEEIEEGVNAIPHEHRSHIIDDESAVERIARWLGERTVTMNDEPICCSYVEKILGLPANSGSRLIPIAALRFPRSVENQKGDFILLIRKK